jgi:CDP-glycerol glycerophosphotransferase (TagB/SpsB family)
LLSDFFINKYCNDINSYLIFQYYQQNNISDAYYIINEESLFYQSLLEKNQTNNLIPINPSTNYWDKLYNFILNSKIIIQSYIFIDFQKIISNVDYLKYLKINHGVRYFKKLLAEYELNNIKSCKYHSIITSPYEYNIYRSKLHLNDTHLFKAGLPRYDRFQNINKNKSENQCILIAFTYRSYDNEVYKKSLFKKNLEKLFKEQTLISFLQKNKIDLIYIPHHYDILRNRPFDANNFPYIKYKTQKDLSHFVEQCSLCVTDFSSISFDFMFQNKPALFYLIDLNDTIDFFEKQYMSNKNETIYFGNVFTEQQSLIEKIKYFINNKFIIGKELKSNYESLFYYKKNITQRIVNIIHEIIEEK